MKKSALLDNLNGEPAVAAVFVPRSPENFVGSVRALQDLTKLPVVVGTPDSQAVGPLEKFDVPVIQTWSAATLVNDVWLASRGHVLALSDAALVPSGALEPALAILAGDLRVGTVSFLSNAAGFLSFPHRNQPIERCIEGYDEETLTRRLRTTTPAAGAVPIPLAAGPAVLLSGVALAAVGLLENARSGIFAAAMADFSFRCRQRGFYDVLDPTTFVARPSDISVDWHHESFATGLSPDDNGWLHERHPIAHAFCEREVVDDAAPMATALAVARAKAQGVRVLVDGRCLGLQEMGTQATTVATIKALATSADIAGVGVMLPGPVPPYAEAALSLPMVRTAREGDLASLGRFDIVHRPFQPNAGFDASLWRDIANRVVVTVHDLISYHVGSYSGSVESWLEYRALMRSSLTTCDAVVVISEDVRQMLEFEQLGIALERVHVVPNGTGHLTGSEPARPPELLVERGLRATEFLFCLGTNYTHKNRDLALQAYLELCRRGFDLALVFAGPAVPWGSSRALEAAFVGEGNVLVLPDVPAIERNWLLRHAAAVLYPTSAEGFGLVPFEAAQFGTPTVHVGFGPLQENLGSLPVIAESWSPSALADAAEALLRDPALAAAQVAACLDIGQTFTWDLTAERLATVYRSVLARSPAR